jgi:uncharacterized protein
MKIENDFRVEAPPDAAWALLNDVPQVVPCMPGASLVEVVGEDAWKARLKTNLGAMSFVFDADLTRESADEATRTVVLAAKAIDQSGRGQATARISSTLTDAGGATRGVITTDLTLAGSIARFGRQGMVEDVAAQLVKQFAANLESKLESRGGAAGSPQQAQGAGATPPGVSGPTAPESGETQGTAGPPSAQEAPPLRAFPLLLRAFGSGIKRRFARLWAAIKRLF